MRHRISNDTDVAYLFADVRDDAGMGDSLASLLDRCKQNRKNVSAHVWKIWVTYKSRC